MTINLLSKQYNERNDSNVNSRNIGEIVISTIPLNDACLHLLDGSIIHGRGVYDAFVLHMAKLYETSPEIFCTEEEYQQSLTDYGVCGKYVYDSTANTVRLPTITGHIEGTNDVTKLGNIIEAGLPNITGKTLGIRHNAHSQNGYASGAFLLLQNSNSPSLRIEGSGTEYYCDFDASRCNKVYNSSETVQTQSIEVFYYIVVANSTKTDVQINIDNVVTDLNRKADISLENAMPEQNFIDKSVGWGMPDYSSAISISALGSLNAYTAPTSGFVSIQQSTRGVAAGQCKINGIIVLYFDNTNNGYVTTRSLVPIKKGDNVYWEVISDGLGIGIEGWFIPANL